jgi:ubiquinone/menaquinone biosynthesis C-methylase UbiE
MLEATDPDRTENAIRIQRQYYTDSATEYDSMHSNEGAWELDNYKYVHALLRLAEARSILDVGAGTGHANLRMREAKPDVTFRGVEPVAALIQQASEKNGIPHGETVQGVGEALPFEDNSFDVVCSFSILHHVARPNHVVREMLRVARKAVLICDGNRFGQGSELGYSAITAKPRSTSTWKKD